MKQIHHTADQIIRKLKAPDRPIAQCMSVADFGWAFMPTQSTYQRWMQQYAGMQAQDSKRLTQLEIVNARFNPHLA